MRHPHKPILVLGGPTASGKTAMALRLAEELEGELVGADSVQVYRGFDLGSAKPSPEELRGIPHHLVDVVEATDTMDAALYQQHADAAIDAIIARGRLPIVVGGTGLWLRALTRGLVDLPPMDPQLRAQLYARAEQIGDHAIHTELRQVDPQAAQTLHPHDRMRIVRALEVYQQTGRALSDWHAEHARGSPRYRLLFLKSHLSAEDTQQRVQTRIQAMLKRGWLDEVRYLHQRYPLSARALQSVGYAQLLAFIEGRQRWEESYAAAMQATRRYAKQQRVWFRGEPLVQATLDPHHLDNPAFWAALRHDLRDNYLDGCKKTLDILLHPNHT